MDVVNASSNPKKFGSPVLGSGSQLRYRGGQAVLPGSPDSGVDHDLSARSSVLGEDSPAHNDGARDTDGSDCELEVSSVSGIEKLRSLYSSVVKSEGKKSSYKHSDTALAVLVAVVMLSSCAFTLLMMTRGMAVKSASSESHKVAMYAERNGKYASMAFAAASANGPEPDVASTKPDVAASEPDEDLVKDEDDPFRFRKVYF